ncbi:MAG: amidohydrolase, partial [Gemmatimonadota bacterium]|nr:amidohydrolase [Gemmatimonadota bacterium]
MMRIVIHPLLLLAALACASGGGSTTTPSTPATTTARDTGAGPGAVSSPNANPFPSTYQPFPSRPTVIRNVTILTAVGPRIENGSVLLRDGKIAAVGPSVDAPADAVVIDGSGKFLTPGIIDTHSHMGVYAAPGVQAHSDGNEATNPVTANVWAEHSVWPQDPQFPRALAGGITTAQILPGSANLIGGRSVVL